LLSLVLAAAGRPASADPRLDELLVKGSHNSFHVRPWLVLHPRHGYEHDPIGVQLEHHGVRAFELDLHRGEAGVLEVYHIAYIDGRSHCRLFADCLKQLRAWSEATPDHEPLFVWIEIKDFAGGERFESVRPVDAAIREVLGDRLLTPDDLRGHHASLRESLRANGWPHLAEARGRIVFMLTADEAQLSDYTDGFQHLRGRVMFPAAEPEQFELPWAAVAKVGDPGSPEVAAARAAGLLVTTTVCVAELDDAECGRLRKLAVTSGAQVLLDDYVRPVPGRDYYLRIEPFEVRHARRVLTGVEARVIRPE
jgi:hypothetical protein